ncbi:hypothetical protein ACWEOI_32380 [Nocardia sp. NPDC004340]
MLEQFSQFFSPLWTPFSNRVLAPLLKRVPAWALAVIVVAVAAAVIVTPLIVNVVGDRTQSSTAPSVPASTSIGGLDLAQYCVSYGYGQVDGQSCEAVIDLGKACDWQYKQTGLHMSFSMNDPYSGMCFTAEQAAKGGIRDMPGYCKATYPTSNEVRPAVIDKTTWVCQAPIDMQIACIWQYQSPKVEARKDGETWICVKQTP